MLRRTAVAQRNQQELAFLIAQGMLDGFNRHYRLCRETSCHILHRSYYCNDDGTLYIDAVLLDTQQLTILFGFSRAYFLVDMEVPSGYVQFLCTLLPRKPVAELYRMLGLQKHGKTLFYRDFLHHLKHSSGE